MATGSNITVKKSEGSKEEATRPKSKHNDTEIENMQDQIETLLEQTEELKESVKQYSEEIKGLHANFDAIAKEKTLAFYLERISEALQKDCGEKPFQNRLKEKSHLGSFY